MSETPTDEILTDEAKARIEKISKLAYGGGPGDPQADVRFLLMVINKLRAAVQCSGDCADECARCFSGDWDQICDDCRFYAAQDAEPAEAQS